MRMRTRLLVEAIAKPENKPFTTGKSAGRERIVSTVTFRDEDDPQFLKMDVKPAEAELLKVGAPVFVEVRGLRTYNGLGTMLSGRLNGKPAWAK